MSKYKVSLYCYDGEHKEITNNIQLVSGNNRVICNKVYTSDDESSYEQEIQVIRGMLSGAKYIKSMKLRKISIYGRYVYIVRLNNSTKIVIMRNVITGKYRYMVNRFISKDYSTVSGCIGGIFTLVDSCQTDKVDVTHNEVKIDSKL